MIFHCACPTRGVCDRALREHREFSGFPRFLFPLSLPPIEGGGQMGPQLRASRKMPFPSPPELEGATRWIPSCAPRPTSAHWERGLGCPQRARVQRGPSEAARCASRRPLPPPDHKSYRQMLFHHIRTQLITLARHHHRPFGHHHILLRQASGKVEPLLDQ